MKHKRTLLMLLPLLVMLSGAWGCNKWEHQTYATLAASKSAIDDLAAQYNAGTIPQTTAVRDAIQKARNTQVVAVETFQAYAEAKVAVKSPDLATLKQNVIVAVAQVTQTIVDLRALIQSLKKPMTEVRSLDEPLRPHAALHVDGASTSLALVPAQGGANAR